jgi:hypothetical protein
VPRTGGDAQYGRVDLNVMKSGEQEKPKAETEIDGGPWQFSLRSLLIVITVASVLLAIGVHYAGVIVALAVVSLMQVGMLVGADWLIRPAHRRALAFVTAASWAVVGSSFVIFAVFSLNHFNSSIGPLGYIFAICMLAVGTFCYYLANLRWRRLTRVERSARSTWYN